MIFLFSGVKLLIDFPAGYTSNTHPWFQHSQQADSVYKDHYVWEDGKKSTDGKRIPPNNWVSQKSEYFNRRFNFNFKFFQDLYF